jgi:recombination protein RecA
MPALSIPPAPIETPPEAAVDARREGLIPWCELAPRLDQLMPRGRLAEICRGGAQTSATVAMLCAVQARGEQVAWVASRSAGLYPPDWHQHGLDLDTLLVVHVPDGDATAGPRAAEMLLRTGALGAIVLDLTSSLRSTKPKGTVLRGDAWMGRLLGLAREHGARVLLLSPEDHEAPSLGALVSVRLAARRVRTEAATVALGDAWLGLEVLKDKSGIVAGVGVAEAPVVVEEKPGVREAA